MYVFSWNVIGVEESIKIFAESSIKKKCEKKIHFKNNIF